jgi:hypothetical protein
MQPIDIKNLQDLTVFIKENTTRSEGDTSTDRERAEWFLAVFEARSCADMRAKDLASLFLNGMSPIAGVDERSNDLIDSFRVEYDEALEMGDDATPQYVKETKHDVEEQWKYALEHHYGATLTIKL